MKNLIPAFILIISVSFMSCSKESVTAPSTAASIQKTSSPISFTNGNIAISGFTAKVSNNEITVGFSTAYQKDVKTLEILRGVTTNNLCSIYKTNVSADSKSSLQYSTEDTQAASTQYYIIKYTLQDNDWGYTPMFTLETGASSSK